MKMLQEELEEITDWQSLGIALCIPKHFLSKIERDCQTTEDKKLEMLYRWTKLQQPSWIDFSVCT